MSGIKLSFTEFKKLMQTVAEGWNKGDARKAADCFHEQATYMEPPDKQLYKGREELFRFFGANSQMSMTWHSLSFNEETQVGMGEYTFQITRPNHGVAVVEIAEGKIKFWREYQWSGDLSFEDFISDRNKEFEWTIKNL